MKVIRAVWVFAFVAALSPPMARADDCPDGPVPFDDMTIYDNYCTEATWAKAARITLGCDENNSFCGGDPVSRAQMALFLRRMAEATFPQLRVGESSVSPSGDLDSAGGLTACTSAPLDIPDDANGMLVHVAANVAMRAGAAADVELGIVHLAPSAPGGPAHFVKQVVTVPAGQWRQGAVLTFYRIAFPGISNAFSVVLSRAPGSATTGEMTDLRCQIKVIAQMPG